MEKQQIPGTTVGAKNYNRRACAAAFNHKIPFFVNVYPSIVHESGVNYGRVLYMGDGRPRKCVSRRALYRLRVTLK